MRIRGLRIFTAFTLSTALLTMNKVSGPWAQAGAPESVHRLTKSEHLVKSHAVGIS
ncbi:MAG: hypothetical protein O3A11_05090 [Actinomycetota bacterium]|nr:hypothetical protein [Actinomycetota bacterium]